MLTNRIFCCLILLVLFTSCKSVKTSLKPNTSQNDLYNVIISVFEHNKTAIVITNINEDKKKLRMLLNKLAPSDTILIIRSDMYLGQSTSLVGYSYSKDEVNLDLTHVDLVKIAYSIQNGNIYANTISHDYFEREEHIMTIKAFFQKPKVAFTEYLENILPNKLSIERGGTSIQYIFVYRIKNNRYSYDVYNLTQ